MRSQPDEIDIHVGKRLRSLRKARGLSQQLLGNCIGVSFQQIQKYEKADNRICIATLIHLAHALGVTSAYFYDGLPEHLLDVKMQGSDAVADLEPSIFLSPEAKKLLAAFDAIHSKKERESVIFLCETLAKLSPDPHRSR